MSGTPSLLQLIEARITAGEVSLPACNRVLGDLQALTQDPDFDLDKVVAAIAQDQALTAELLRVANSSFYGGLTEITTVRDAAVRLGTPEVLRLTALVTEKGQYEVCTPQLKDYIKPLWDHAVAVAQGAGWLAQKLGYPNLRNEAFVGGLLHDVGALVLLRAIDDIQQEGQHELNLSAALLHEIFESAHTSQGHALATSWDLPDIYREIVRDHHEAELSERGPLLNIVALADKAACQAGIGMEHDPSLVLAATEEAHTLGATEIQLAQLAVMLEDSGESARIPL